jgi:hypothetical protein
MVAMPNVREIGEKLRHSNPLLKRAAVGLAAALFAGAARADWTPASPPPGTRLRFAVLSGQTGAKRPFASVDFVYGPAEDGGKSRWWQLAVRSETNQDALPLFELRALADGDPLRGKNDTIRFGRYQLRIPETSECYEYRDSVSGGGSAPAWGNFQSDFLPRPAETSARGSPGTCAFLGHTLSLQSREEDSPWKAWANPRLLNLNREVLVGTGRNFKDTEGKRIAGPPARDYTYARFNEANYHTMFAAGMNLFIVDEEQENRVRGEPVFYYRQPWGKYPQRFPADLYRSNYRGVVMFMDEPAEILFEDTAAVREARRPSDLAALFGQRTRATYWSAENYGVWQLDGALRRSGVNLGDMRLAETDFPLWETHIEAAFYELKAGGAGIVNEARYQTEQFNSRVAAATGLEAKYTPLELLKFHHALMRGAARSFGKFWGTAIYGQCDPAIAPLALSAAYDAGARYFWFWTSDHDHHVPWVEQLALAKQLQEHAAAAPRRSIFLPRTRRDAVIVIPDGYFIAYGKPGWDRGFDPAPDGPREKLRRVTRRAFEAMNECLKRNEDFDFTVDDGRPIEGYHRVIRVGPEDSAGILGRK